MLDGSRTELDPAKREAPIKQISRTVHDDEAAIPLCQPKRIYDISTKGKSGPLPTAQLPVNGMTLLS